MRESIGRYKVTGRLGEGGMGLVYEAWDDRLGRAVAVKMIRSACTTPRRGSGSGGKPAPPARSAIPNICHIYEIGEDGEDLFIAMERLTGESLAERLQRGVLPPQEAAQVALGALAALEAVHARGLLHRDLKPSNVYLTPHGVKLLDFGLAVAVATDTEHTLPMLTLPGMVLGTPGYMAPEQILGQPVDARSDLYALGAMLFEMLSGGSPVPRDHARGILARVLSERVPALSGSPAVIAIDRVIQRALARAPGDRYASAAEMAQDLRGVLRFSDSRAMPGVTAIRRLIVAAVPAAAGGPGHRLPRLRPGGRDQRVARRAGRARRPLESHGCPLHGRHSGSCADRRRGRRRSRDEWNSPAGRGADPGQRAAARRARRHTDLDPHAAGRADRPLRGAGRFVTPDR